MLLNAGGVVDTGYALRTGGFHEVPAAAAKAENRRREGGLRERRPSSFRRNTLACEYSDLPPMLSQNSEVARGCRSGHYDGRSLHNLGA